MNPQNYFDTFNANTSGLRVQVTTIGAKFVVTLVCVTCADRIETRGSASAVGTDENLARAVAFALDDFRKLRHRH